MIRILETERLYLREFEPGDLDALARIYSDIDVMRYIGRGETFSRGQTEKSITSWKGYSQKHGFTNWAVIRKDGDFLIGKCGFSWLPDDSDIEVSYLLAKHSWGFGYAAEIAAAALEYGFSKLGLERIAAIVYPDNIASIRVLEKLGMKYEHEAFFHGAKLLLYSAVRSET
jgi:ribosomal-protein-alanine N-acetyltransferase